MATRRSPITPPSATDALVLPAGGLEPLRELARRIECVAGSVELEWSVEPRFRYGADPGRAAGRGGVPVVQAGADAVALRAWNAGSAQIHDGGISGSFELRDGERALLVLAAAHQEPL